MFVNLMLDRFYVPTTLYNEPGITRLNDPRYSVRFSGEVILLAFHESLNSGEAIMKSKSQIIFCGFDKYSTSSTAVRVSELTGTQAGGTGMYLIKCHASRQENLMDITIYRTMGLNKITVLFNKENSFFDGPQSSFERILVNLEIDFRCEMPEGEGLSWFTGSPGSCYRDRRKVRGTTNVAFLPR